MLVHTQFDEYKLASVVSMRWIQPASSNMGTRK